MTRNATTIADVVRDTVGAGLVCQFATMTQANLPLNTPMLYRSRPESLSVDVSTGASYPLKAERVRRNDRVGILVEADDGGPVVSICARGTVRDADIAANAIRYVQSYTDLLPMLTGGRPWSEIRHAVWYWSRIFIECAPESIMWWDSAAATDGAAHRWDNPEPGPYFEHDPAPPRKQNTKSHWAEPADWRARAEEVLATLPTPHITVADPNGYPRPFPTRAAELTARGFALDIATGAPWAARGTASVCFSGHATFAGTLEQGELIVERALPELPLTQDTNQIFEPGTQVRSALMSRLLDELDRRGQPAPVMPEKQPVA